VRRHEFLTGLHLAVAPRSYIEIGVNDGRGLVCSNTRTIGVDPHLRGTLEVRPDVQLVEATSDDFFARPDALAWFDQGTVDFTFVDGMHLFEFAFRDFINAERLSTPGSIVVFDDMLPRSSPEAARDRITGPWAGDVFKVAAVLAAYRPDLIVIPINTEPTGLLLVVGLDPASTVLSDNYDKILAEYVMPDPQVVPAAVIHRTEAADPAEVLASPIWGELAAARDAGEEPPASLRRLLDLRGTADYVSDPPPMTPWRPKSSRRSAAKPQSVDLPGASSASAPKSALRRLQAAIRRQPS
jgi:hypothetical protein